MTVQNPRLKNLLDDWRAAGLPFASQPKLIKELTDGSSNQSYLIEADNEYWVLRLDFSKAAQLGVNREREIRIHQLVSKADLAPHCLVADAKQGYLVTRFVEEDLTARPITPQPLLECLYTLFTKLHRLSLDGEPFDYAAQLNRLSNNGTLPGEVVNSLELIQAEGKVGLCHHDPNRSNIVFTQKGPILLDWEYAAQGYPIIDIAALAHEWNFQEKNVINKFGVDTQLLKAGLIVYREMCRLWEASAKSLKLL